MPTAPSRRLAQHLLPRIRRGSRTALLLAVLAAVVLGGCGNGDDTVEAAPSTTTTFPTEFLEGDVQVIAEDIDFPTDAYTAPPGELTIAYFNQGAIRHTLLIEDVDAFPRLQVDAHGDAASAPVTLEPGRYVLYCDIPGHRRAGMEATLTVEG